MSASKPWCILALGAGYLDKALEYAYYAILMDLGNGISAYSNEDLFHQDA